MKVIAHRGWSSRAPENTRSAIDEAIDLGVDMVEIDIRRTKDDQIVVFHDYNESCYVYAILLLIRLCLMKRPTLW